MAMYEFGNVKLAMVCITVIAVFLIVFNQMQFIPSIITAFLGIISGWVLKSTQLAYSVRQTLTYDRIASKVYEKIMNTEVKVK